MKAAISGTSSGIGLAIAKKFLNEGHEVFGFDIAQGAISHPAYRHFIHDVRDRELPCSPLNDGIMPDIVISNAGTTEEADAIEVNLNGAIRFAERFIDSPELSSVLFIASASARNGAEFPYYVASKAGLVGYMKYLAGKLAKRGVTVNSISPGGVITPMNRHILESPVLYEKVLDENLFRKWAEPSEIAELAYYLTVINRSMTGEDLLIDNGEQLKSNFIW